MWSQLWCVTSEETDRYIFPLDIDRSCKVYHLTLICTYLYCNCIELGRDRRHAQSTVMLVQCSKSGSVHGTGMTSKWISYFASLDIWWLDAAISIHIQRHRNQRVCLHRSLHTDLSCVSSVRFSCGWTLKSARSFSRFFIHVFRCPPLSFFMLLFDLICFSAFCACVFSSSLHTWQSLFLMPNLHIVYLQPLTQALPGKYITRDAYE